MNNVLSSEQQEVLGRFFPRTEDRFRRLLDVLDYAKQDPNQTLIPDGLLTDIEAIVPALREQLYEKEGMLEDYNNYGDVVRAIDRVNDRLTASQAKITALEGALTTLIETFRTGPLTGGAQDAMQKARQAPAAEPSEERPQ